MVLFICKKKKKKLFVFNTEMKTGLNAWSLHLCPSQEKLCCSSWSLKSNNLPWSRKLSTRIAALICMCRLASVSPQFCCTDEHSEASQKIMYIPCLHSQSCKDLGAVLIVIIINLMPGIKNRIANSISK